MITNFPYLNKKSKVVGKFLFPNKNRQFDHSNIKQKKSRLIFTFSEYIFSVLSRYLN